MISAHESHVFGMVNASRARPPSYQSATILTKSWCVLSMSDVFSFLQYTLISTASLKKPMRFINHPNFYNKRKVPKTPEGRRNRE